MKLNKTEIILLTICIVCCCVFFTFKQESLGFIFIFFAIFIMAPKGTLKKINLFELEFYPVEPALLSLVTASPEWIKSNLDIHEINISQIPLYLKLTLKEELILTSPFNENKKIAVSNLEKFKKYKSLGYYGFTTIDIALESKYSALLQFFELLQKCTISHQTSQDTLEQIILNIQAKELPFMTNEENTISSPIYTVQEYLNIERCETKTDTKYYSITKRYPDFNESEDWIFWEIQRADFSQSGCEEIFVLCYYHSAGTMNFYYPMLIRHISGRYDVLNIKDQSSWIENFIDFILQKYIKLKIQFYRLKKFLRKI